MTHSRKVFSPVFVAALCAAVLFVHSKGFSQQFEPPEGESVSGKIIFPGIFGSLTRDTWTGKCIYRSYYLTSKIWTNGVPVYCSPKDLKILDVLHFFKGNKEYELVLLSDGSVIDVSKLKGFKSSNLSASESPKKLIGDALYTLTTQNIYVSRDTAKTWTIDTTGLGAQPNDIAVDSEQFVYAITGRGLFRQSPDTNIWRAMTLPGLASWNKVFVDRLDRIYVSGVFNQRPLLFRSLDRGTTWTPDTAGLGGTSAFSFGDDAYGNVYVVTAQSSYTSAGDQIYRSNGTAWTRIDLPIAGANTDSLNKQAIFTAVGGDTALIATSIYGVFSSTDQGATWTESNDGIAANYFYGLVQTPSKRMLASTNLGIFGINPTDTAWQKTYPQTGYLGGQPLFRDNTGAIYTSGPLVVQPDFATNPYPPRMTMKSTDGGVTWQPDTLGLAALSHISSFLFFVDETGAQHLATYSGGSTPSSMYVKAPSQPWKGDTAGFATNENAPQAFGSDGNGSLWLSIGSQTIPSLWRRAVTGGAWSPDTAGLGTETLNSFATAKNGTVYAGGFIGVWKRTPSKWSYILPPTGIYPGATAYSVSMDSSGALIAGYQHFDPNYNSIGDGVFATTNDGQTWTNLGHVDTSTFKQFISYGDTTYGLSYNDGMFVFTTGTSGVGDEPVPVLAQLNIYPNPASGNITIEVNGAISTKVEVFDELGNLLRAVRGTDIMSWDGRDAAGSDIASGNYFVRVTGMDEQGHPFRASKQLVIQR